MGTSLGPSGLHIFDEHFTSIYRGTIVDNNDPLQTGRVKVKVYPMFVDIATEAIPWAILLTPIWEGAGSGTGYFAVPKVGSNVYVQFENGNPYQPIVIGEAKDAVHGLPSERTTNYPNRKVLKTASGVTIVVDDTTRTIDLKTPANNEIKIDDTTNYISILHSTGARITIDSIGQILISCLNINVVTTGSGSYGNVVANINGNVDVTVQGHTNLTSVGPTTIRGSVVHINP